MNVKIKTLPELIKIVIQLKREKKVIVFTNGCFDLIHIGHIRYLRAAKEQGDILIVGLNSDNSIKSIKGDKRPIVPEEQRAEILTSFEFVDYIVIFSENNPSAIIDTLLPNILVKGEDWEMDNIIGRETVEASGGKVVRVPEIKNIATTNIIDTIIKRYCT